MGINERTLKSTLVVMENFRETILDGRTTVQNSSVFQECFLSGAAGKCFALSRKSVCPIFASVASKMLFANTGDINILVRVMANALDCSSHWTCTIMNPTGPRVVTAQTRRIGSRKR